jgi:hypothetical protein
LGAEVFMFARNDDQTWEAYRQLLIHLRRSQSIQWGMPDDDLRWRLKMVAGQLESDEGAVARFQGIAYDVWSELYDEEDLDAEPSGFSGVTVEPQVFALDDAAAPHSPLPIFHDANLRGLSLADPMKRPDWRVIESTFGGFLSAATARLLPSEVLKK